MSYSWVFFVNSAFDYPFHFCNPAKVCFSLVFKTITGFGGKGYMGYVQFLRRQDPETLKRKYPHYEWFESANDEAIIAAYRNPPCNADDVVEFGFPRPKGKELAAKLIEKGVALATRRFITVTREEVIRNCLNLLNEFKPL